MKIVKSINRKKTPFIYYLKAESGLCICFWKCISNCSLRASRGPFGRLNIQPWGRKLKATAETLMLRPYQIPTNLRILLNILSHKDTKKEEEEWKRTVTESGCKELVVCVHVFSEEKNTFSIATYFTFLHHFVLVISILKNRLGRIETFLFNPLLYYNILIQNISSYLHNIDIKQDIIT